jgi:peptidoglycan/xylan/chitin deacetylase (PgdA/CDA1 family)
MRFGYLTIDDSPSPHTDQLTDFLVDRGIPALLFCVGERLAERPEPIIRAIQKGFVIGNHSYHHWRSSKVSFEDFTEDILKTEELIEAAYTAAGEKRSAKYFRFPHMDRGTGGWIVDYSRVNPVYREEVIRLFADGLNIDLTPPPPDLMEKKERLQRWLKQQGFSKMPCEGVTFPWFQGGEMEEAIDAMYTFSVSDWMLLNRHRGKWPWKTLDDLKNRMDTDKHLQNRESTHIILAHDKEEIDFVTRDLLDHLLGQEFQFLPFTEKPKEG